MTRNNRRRLITGELFKLLPILMLAFYIAFIPHQNYPYPVHIDEWLHMTYAKTLLQTGSTVFAEPFVGEWPTGISYHLFHGYHVLWGTFQQVTNIPWLIIARCFPGIIFMITVLSVYILAKREGFGWEAAFFTCLIPTSVQMFGPAFMVPMATGLLIIPLSLFLTFNIKTWPSYLLLFIFACFLLSTHPPSAIGLYTILIPYILLNLKGNLKHSIGIALALTIPFIASCALIIETLRPIAELLLTPQPPSHFINQLSPMQNYGYLPIALGALGITILATKGGKKNHGLILGLLALLLMLIIFFRLHYGLTTLYARELIYMMLMINIFAGAGLLWIRTIKLTGTSLSKLGSFLYTNLGNISCLFLIGIILAIAIPNRLNTPYYHMIDHEDYQAFVWVRDNIGEDYRLAILDPWEATAFTAITQKNVYHRLWSHREPIDDMIDQFLASGCRDTTFLRYNGISIVYSQKNCDNPDLVEVRKNIYLTNPNLSSVPSISGRLQNPGFWEMHDNLPVGWYSWSQHCTPIFLYPETGRSGVYCVGIEMFETEPFDPWPVAIWLQNMPVEAGISYTIGAWIRTEDIVGWGGAMIAPHWKGPEDTLIGHTEFMSYVQGTSDWTYYQGEVTAPPGATVCTISCLISGCSGTAWFDDIVFKEKQH